MMIIKKNKANLRTFIIQFENKRRKKKERKGNIVIVLCFDIFTQTLLCNIEHSMMQF
jgi:hypothetical protein